MVLVLATSLATARAAHAAPPRTVHVAGPADGCPRAAAVGAALGRIAPRLRLVPGPGAQVVVRVEDRGATYRVALGAVDRVLQDPGRDCAERARVAAVLVAVTLFPPGSSLDEEPPSSAPTSLPHAPPRVTPTPADHSAPTMGVSVHSPQPRGWWTPVLVSLDAGALTSLAPGSGGGAPPTSIGAALHVRATRGSFGLALGIASGSAASLHLSQGGVTLTRVPFTLDALAAVRWRRLELLGELGIGAGVLIAEGDGFDAGLRASRLEVGVHAGAVLRWWPGRRWAPFLALDALVVPVPYDLTVEGGSDVGRTPRAWLNLTAGIAVRLH